MTTRMRWWFASFIVAVFLAGTSIGVVVDRLWLLRRGDVGIVQNGVPATGRRGGPPDPGELAAANLRRIENRLRLTPEQAEQARPILEAWQQRVAVVQNERREQLQNEMLSLERDLAAILTANQRARLSAIGNFLLVPSSRGRMGRGGERDQLPPFRGGRE